MRMTPRIGAHSPRPFSSACILEGDETRLFLKRHHIEVKTISSLEDEHQFLTWLKLHGIKMDTPLPCSNGQSWFRLGEWVYEVFNALPGCDLYREVPSWDGWLSTHHAEMAGRTLGQLHNTTRLCNLPARRDAFLVSSDHLLREADFGHALDQFTDAIGPHAAQLRQRPVYQDARKLFSSFHTALAPLMPHLTPCWNHGDWHGSNLMWSDGSPQTARPIQIFDFGMADQSSIQFDLAVAIERSMITWLEPSEANWCVRLTELEAFLHGYTAEHPLRQVDMDSVSALLPLCHIHFSLSEYAYYRSLLNDELSAEEAFNTYFFKHGLWFHDERGQTLLRYLLEDAPRGQSKAP